MSTSGSNTGALRPYTARQMLEEALRRAGIKPAQFTSEMVESAYDIFNVMLDEQLNLGIQLWARDQIILPIYQNQNQIPCPLGTSLVISANQRTLMRVEASVAFTDGAGSPGLAFDDDFATACINTAPNGYIGAFFAEPTTVTTVGILFEAAGQFGLFYEYTTDGVTWTAIDASDVVAAAGQWLWVDIEGVEGTTGFRVRSVGNDNFAVSEMFFGNTPQEIPMGMWSNDDWNAMPVKTTPGQPINWYQDRQLDTPVLYVWPMPDNTAKYMQVVCWRRRYLNQLTDMMQTLDISRRWNEAITASLARRFCRSIPEADMNRYNMLNSEETAAMNLAIGEERDPAPVRYNPGLEVYTKL
jgi:hypothetical protein